MFVVKFRKIFFTIGLLFVAAAITSVLYFGLIFGIDFTGGSLLEVSYSEERVNKESISNQLDGMEMGLYSLREIGDSGYILKTKDLNVENHEAVLSVFSQGGEVEVTEERFNSVGPTVGAELRNKAVVALLLVVFAIILFVAFAFRKVSEPVSSWKYGVIAIVALIHDIFIPVGIFAALGHYVGAEIDVLFIMALLAILGYSVNDTIVVFDRVRENLRFNKEKNKKEDFELTVGKSIKQTFTRSINTSLTTIFVLLALFFIGPVATENFALVLLTGVMAGTFSSIFLAAPLLVTIQGWRYK